RRLGEDLRLLRQVPVAREGARGRAPLAGDARPRALPGPRATPSPCASCTPRRTRHAACLPRPTATPDKTPVPVIGPGHLSRELTRNPVRDVTKNRPKRDAVDLGGPQ